MSRLASLVSALPQEKHLAGEVHPITICARVSADSRDAHHDSDNNLIIIAMSASIDHNHPTIISSCVLGRP